jgi:hypothetical protein
LAQRRPHGERHGGAETHEGTTGDVLAHVSACGIDETSGKLMEGSVFRIPWSGRGGNPRSGRSRSRRGNDAQGGGRSSRPGKRHFVEISKCKQYLI